ncbi:putative mannose-P-dolichol utilization defect 1 protein [Helianthus debilis subsp. tardiflorus]
MSKAQTDPLKFIIVNTYIFCFRFWQFGPNFYKATGDPPNRQLHRTVKMVRLEFMGMDFTCVYESLTDAKFPPKDCLLPLISKLLGYAIVAASTTVKLPQIMKIIQHKSVRGLSVLAFEMEVVGYTIALAYCLHKGLPFSAYGELAFLLIQAIILVATIYYFSPRVGNFTWIRALLYCGLAPTILAGKIDPLLFEALYASQHAIFFFARVPQIWENFKNKSTGELSFLTSFMNSLGSIVRVFTSLQEKAPTSVVMGSVVGILTNGAILSQIIIYQKPTKKEKKKD